MQTYGIILQWSVICLVGVGLGVMNSASITVGGDPVTLETMLTDRQVIYAGLAILAMSIVGYVDVRRLYVQRGMLNPVIWMLGLAVVLCGLALVPGLGRNVNGASRWLYI